MVSNVARRCAHPHVERTHRQNLIDSLVGLAGFRPYRCIICDMRWYRRVDGTNWSGLLLLLLAVCAVVIPILLASYLGQPAADSSPFLQG